LCTYIGRPRSAASRARYNRRSPNPATTAARTAVPRRRSSAHHAPRPPPTTPDPAATAVGSLRSSEDRLDASVARAPAAGRNSCAHLSWTSAP
jgi:hypothetical protein